MTSSKQKQESFSFTAGDLNIFHARLLADQQITYILDFAGHLDEARLKAGLIILNQALPVLSSIVKVHKSNFTRELAATNSPPALHVSDSTNDVEEETQRFVNTPCDPLSETPLKILAIHATRGDRLCVKVDHVLTDAGGLKFLLYLIAEAYSKGKIDQPINNNRDFGQIFRKFSFFTGINAIRKAKIPRPGPALIAGPFDRDSFFIEHFSLDPQQFERLHDLANESDATINDILLTAVYRVVFNNLSMEPNIDYPIMIPVDMRRYISKEKQNVIGNLFSAIYPRALVKPGENFEETLASIRTIMDALKKGTPGLGLALLITIGAVGGGNLLRNRYKKIVSTGLDYVNLTNFGIIDETRCKFGDLQPTQVHAVGPVQYAPGILIAVSTYQNRLHLVLHGNDTQRFQPFIHEFLESIKTDLTV
jgi:NRPS condensation-like uncharacterized protein